MASNKPINIVLLGDVDVGKETFISKLPEVQHPRTARNTSSDSSTPLHRTTSVSSLPAYTNLDAGPPSYQPNREGKYEFHVSLYARPYHIILHTNTSSLIASPGDSLPDRFSLAVFAFSIPSRTSLHNVIHYWAKRFHLLYPSFSGPIMLLGLKRDLRTNKQISASDTVKEGLDGGVRHGPSTTNTSGPVLLSGAKRGSKVQYECVMPMEGLQAARMIRADGYAECSAETGELMFEVLEDLTKMAAKTTVKKGQASSGGGCIVM